MAPPTTTWPAAVSARSVALVHGAPRPATVLAVFPTALYLRVGGHCDVLPVVTRGGLRLPTALAVATDLPTVGWGAQPGDEVVVGGGAVRLAAVTLRAVRTWHPRSVPRATTALRAGRLSTLSLPWRAPARGVVDLLLRRDRASYALADRVGALVGAGPGLTPSGDDVLCGVLLGLHLHAHSSPALVAELWPAVEPRLAATTSLSAALLREAAEGYAAEPVTRLLECLATPATQGDAAPLREAVRAVLAIGHTSGADLLGGLAGCLDALSSPSVVTPPTMLTTPATLPADLPATPRSLP